MTPGPDVVLVVGGEGDLPLGVAPAALAGAVVVAADSGLHAALDLRAGGRPPGRRPRLGRPGRWPTAEAAGATVHRHPADKDATDSELAVDLVLGLLRSIGCRTRGRAARAARARPAAVAGSTTCWPTSCSWPRPAWRALEVTARLGPATVTVVRPGRPRRVTGGPVSRCR